MCDKRQDQVLLDLNSRKCSVCETYQRKVEDVEQSLSGRDAIISILQSHLKKCETNYKNLFDEFEKLRFEHCTALQDNYSLKEINAKLEEFEFKNKCNDLKDTCANTNRSSSSNLGNKRVCPESKNPIVQEVNNIEHLVANQNQILQDLQNKIINELKFSKCGNPDISQSICQIQEDYKNIESGDHLDIDPKVQELLSQVDALKVLLNRCQEENKCMKQLLRDRKNNLSECQNLLENSSRSIHKISTSIDDLIRDKSMQKKTMESCCDKYKGVNSPLDPINTTVSMDEQIYKNKISQLELEMKRKEKEYEMCKCNMLSQMNDIADNNQILSDTLDIMKAENKNNLEAVAKLKEELKKVNDECENKQKKMKLRISELEHELESSHINEKKMRNALGDSSNETKKLIEHMKLLPEENSTKKSCSCNKGDGLQQKITDLEYVNAEIKKELNEKTVELNEYEEENKALNQKMESMSKSSENLRHRINELEKQLSKKNQEGEQLPSRFQMSADFSYQDLAKKVGQLEEENRCLGDQCILGQTQKLMEIESLKNTLKIKMETIEKLSKENADLKDQIEHQKSENKQDTEKLQAMVNHSQQQVELLLQEHDEKTAQIQVVANELDGIRRSVTEENNNFYLKIDQLERERDQLQKKLGEYEKGGGGNCQCAGKTLEIERLRSEICKKQCVIFELEKSIENFNMTMKQFERHIDSLACENACLKDDKDKQLKDIEGLRKNLTEKMAEIGNIQEQLKSSKHNCDTCTNQSRNLERENEKLRKEFDRLNMDHVMLTRSAATEKLDLQMEIDRLKDQSKRNQGIFIKLESSQNAYEELRNQCAKKCLENEKLKEELQNSKRLSEELQKKSQNLQCECNKLKNANRVSIEEQYKISQRIENLQECCDELKRQYTTKSLECEDLKVKIDEQKKDCGKRDKGCEELTKKLTANEGELRQATEKLNELKNDCDQKCQELKKIRKLYECCYKQSQISRDEYNNLRREYKEIKTMLSDQIKRYKTDNEAVEAGQSNQKSCKVISDLRKQLHEKDKQIAALQQKHKDSSYEIIELKDYIHKLISDNNILKSAINNLIGNLERKIKGPNFNNLPCNSADAIAGEILQSLTSIESAIIKKSQYRSCSQGCPGNDCDCLSQIQSQYNVKEAEQGTSNDLCSSECCSKPKCETCVSHQSTNIGSEQSTTDSEECNFLNQKSVEFLKQALHGLRTSKDNTMKEKSCDCERR